MTCRYSAHPTGVLSRSTLGSPRLRSRPRGAADRERRGQRHRTQGRCRVPGTDGRNPQEPKVTTQGFPILTQVTRVRLDQVGIAAEDMTADETRPPPVITLDMTMDGPTAPADARRSLPRPRSPSSLTRSSPAPWGSLSALWRHPEGLARHPDTPDAACHSPGSARQQRASPEDPRDPARLHAHAWDTPQAGRARAEANSFTGTVPHRAAAGHRRSRAPADNCRPKKETGSEVRPATAPLRQASSLSSAG
ncbi:LmeA family phospholipid-binding protein [Streptomyces sp. NPDC096013]|uniref:LmeA family phospholipid-binding protein n=1 Tax=Streptomyces sp. NPDC096013 TaxID=3366069 RepID=UPI0038139463